MKKLLHPRWLLLLVLPFAIGGMLYVLHWRRYVPSHIVATPDGSRFVVVCHSHENVRLRVYETESLRSIRSINLGPTGRANSLAISSDGRFVAWVDVDSRMLGTTTRVVDIATGTTVGQYDSHGVTFTPDSTGVVLVNEAGIEVRRVSDGKVIASEELRGCALLEAHGRLLQLRKGMGEFAFFDVADNKVTRVTEDGRRIENVFWINDDGDVYSYKNGYVRTSASGMRERLFGLTSSTPAVQGGSSVLTMDGTLINFSTGRTLQTTATGFWLVGDDLLIGYALDSQAEYRHLQLNRLTSGRQRALHVQRVPYPHVGLMVVGIAALWGLCFGLRVADGGVGVSRRRVMCDVVAAHLGVLVFVGYWLYVKETFTEFSSQNDLALPVLFGFVKGYMLLVMIWLVFGARPLGAKLPWIILAFAAIIVGAIIIERFGPLFEIATSSIGLAIGLTPLFLGGLVLMRSRGLRIVLVSRQTTVEPGRTKWTIGNIMLLTLMSAIFLVVVKFISFSDESPQFMLLFGAYGLMVAFVGLLCITVASSDRWTTLKLVALLGAMLTSGYLFSLAPRSMYLMPPAWHMAESASTIICVLGTLLILRGYGYRLRRER